MVVNCINMILVVLKLCLYSWCNYSYKSREEVCGSGRQGMARHGMGSQSLMLKKSKSWPTKQMPLKKFLRLCTEKVELHHIPGNVPSR